MKLEHRTRILKPQTPQNDENCPPNIPSPHYTDASSLKFIPLLLPEAENYRSDIETYVLSLS